MFTLQKSWVSHCEGCILLQCFIHGDLPKACFQVQTRKILSPYKNLNGLMYVGQWIRIFLGPCIQLAEVYAEAQTSTILSDQHDSITPWTLARAYNTYFQPFLHVDPHFLNHRRWDSLKSLLEGFSINNSDLMFCKACAS